MIGTEAKISSSQKIIANVIDAIKQISIYFNNLDKLEIHLKLGEDSFTLAKDFGQITELLKGHEITEIEYISFYIKEEGIMTIDFYNAELTINPSPKTSTIGKKFDEFWKKIYGEKV